MILLIAIIENFWILHFRENANSLFSILFLAVTQSRCFISVKASFSLLNYLLLQFLSFGCFCVCVCVCVYVCVWVCVSLNMRERICVCKYICEYLVCVCLCVFLGVSVCLSDCFCVFVCVFAHASVWERLCVCMCLCVCVRDFCILIKEYSKKEKDGEGEKGGER